jgi:hypothetical protein
VSRGIERVYIIEYREKILESPDLSGDTWIFRTRHECKQAIKSVLIGLPDVDAFVHKHLQK